MHDDIAGQEIVEFGTESAGVFQGGIEIVGDLRHCGVRIFRQDEIDRQAADAAVGGDQAPGDLGSSQGNGPDAGQVGIAQRLCVVDQRLDHQIVFHRFAVGIVGEGIDPCGIGGAPGGLGQFLDRPQRLDREDGTHPGRNGDQCPVGCGVRVLQGIECRELGIVFVEQDSVVVRGGDVLSPCRHDQHDDCRDHGHRPPAVQDDSDVAVQDGRRHFFLHQGLDFDART